MNYNAIRDKMMIGDLVAFGGKGLVSTVIKRVTQSEVSHVGIVLYSYIGGQKLVQLMESTSLGEGFAGVKISRLSDHIKNYKGDIWWYPISLSARKSFKKEPFTKFLLEMEGVPYDTPQAILSAIEFLPDSGEDFTRMFCSELVSEAYERSGLAHKHNSSTMTPQDVCEFDFLSVPITLEK